MKVASWAYCVVMVLLGAASAMAQQCKVSVNNQSTMVADNYVDLTTQWSGSTSASLKITAELVSGVGAEKGKNELGTFSGVSASLQGWGHVTFEKNGKKVDIEEGDKVRIRFEFIGHGGSVTVLLFYADGLWHSLQD